MPLDSVTGGPTPCLLRLQETFDHYAKASGLGSETKVAAALERWGPNLFDVPLPKFSALLQVPARRRDGLVSHCHLHAVQTDYCSKYGHCWRLMRPALP